MSRSLKELRNLTDDEIIEKHDRLAESMMPGVNHYLNEIVRRDQSRQTEVMLTYTKKINRMTYLIAFMTCIMMVFTIANIVVAIYCE